MTERARFEAYLERLVGVPTVSSDPAHAADIQHGAKLAAGLLEEAGFEARVVPTTGHPVVLGKLVADPAYPTLTIYNHLDVQPADAADWRTDPFKLTTRAGRYYGRGATDDKGPATTALMAMRRALERQIPLNFIVIWEFEEEIGSTHFEEFLTKHKSQLHTDSVLVSDTEWLTSSKPAIPYGLRGLVTFEVTIHTAARDGHSGSVGGAARNPLGELAQIIAECYDATTGQVHIPGFYDAVRRPTATELDGFASSGFDLADFKQDNELHTLRTEEPRAVLSRIWAEPTFEVHGIAGGHTGPGVKTIVPPTATAKLSCRLVPAQDPHIIFRLISDFITSRHPDAKVALDAAAKPFLADPTGPYVKAAAQAAQSAFGAEPALIREGGTIGAVLTMSELLRAPIVMLGLSLPEHGYHAPNEHFDWHQASKGMDAFESYFEKVAKLGRTPRKSP
jgi:acetylornithine deacetylase/succinyl-diaminopimelate desuccinylase-like protein